jgi:hypothetical protein
MRNLIPEHGVGTGLSRASPAMISAAYPCRSSSDEPIALRLLCKARSDCASHQRAALPSGRTFRTAARAWSNMYRQITGLPVIDAACRAG